MKGIPGKEYEPTCPGCGHPVSEHSEIGCQHLTLWVSNTWGTYCCKCGIKVGGSTADPIRPEKVVEPAEKRYIVRELFKADDTYNFENAKTHAMIAAKKHHGKYIVALIVGESTHKVESIEWHEEQ